MCQFQERKWMPHFGIPSRENTHDHIGQNGFLLLRVCWYDRFWFPNMLQNISACRNFYQYQRKKYMYLLAHKSYLYINTIGLAHVLALSSQTLLPVTSQNGMNWIAFTKWPMFRNPLLHFHICKVVKQVNTTIATYVKRRICQS